VKSSCIFSQKLICRGQDDLILDAESEIRLLGRKLAKKSNPVNILLSHSHWDHIQGYPLFDPIYQPGRVIDVYVSVESGRMLLNSLMVQMDGTHFPVRAEDLPSFAMPKFKGIESEGIQVVRQPLNHPGGSVAYRIEENGIRCAYVTDNELDPPHEPATRYDQWVNYLHGVDLLIQDAQYTQDNMPHRHGWGHSLISQVRQLAADAEVRMLFMFHHDPDRTDAELDEIQIENDKYLKSMRAPTRCVCAAEGMKITLTKPFLGGSIKSEIGSEPIWNIKA
jgi:phosphoribosyl 1,2-cyclic phosphodiesterase